MGAVKNEESTSPQDLVSHCVDPQDPLDIDQYINADDLTIPSAPMSPLSSSLQQPSTDATSLSSNHGFLHSQNEQPFSGPSHQYEQYRQQSSLPVGAVANTFALNESNYAFDHDDYDMIPAESYLSANGTNDYLDLRAEHNDLDMDFNSQPTFSSVGNGMSPSVGSSTTYQTPATPHVRAWPGMHQHAAMQAKAQAEAQAQRQQQVQQQSIDLSRTPTASRPENEDPHVEESISRLLNRMRQSSVASTNMDDPNSSNSNGNMYGSRSKKDEDDMDEDERLLASEEGKKLSSKERRQLRNKVSARAFRSRRKEYIGQLEGEIAAKATEADRLRARNDQLVAENTRLTDLTRMLLSSPHFSHFLDDLSANNGNIPGLPQTAPSEPSNGSQGPPSAPKDVNPNSQQNPRVGLAMIPEHPYEFEQAQQPSQRWNSSQSYDQRVFAVTSIPEEPVLDGLSLSGKSTSGVFSTGTYSGVKHEVPALPSLPLFVAEAPEVAEAQVDESVDFDESNPAYDLFAEPCKPAPSSHATVAGGPTSDSIFGQIALEKAFGRLELVIADGLSSTTSTSLAKFETLRMRLDDLGSQIEAVTGDL